MALVFMEGHEASKFAPLLWDSLPFRARAAILWDVPMEARDKALENCLGQARHAAVYFDQDGPIGAAWAVPVGHGTRTGNAHFVLPLEQERLDAAGRAMDRYFGRHFDCLLGFIPVHFRGARAFVERMRFHEIARLTKACFIQLHQRCIDGCLYLWRSS